MCSLFLRRLAFAFALVVILSAGLTLIGWWLHIEFFTRLRPNWPAMVPLTASGFLLAGWSILSLIISIRSAHTAHIHRLWKYSSIISAILVSLVAAAGFIANRFGIKAIQFLDFSTLVYLDIQGPDEHAPGTAINFFLLSGALLAFHLRSVWLLTFLSVPCQLLGWLGITRYVYGGQPLSPYAGMALHTAASFIALAAALIFLRTDRGLARLLCDSSYGGVIVRQLLLPALILPYSMGWLLLSLNSIGWPGLEASVSILVILSVFIFSCLIWYSAHTLARLEQEKKTAQSELLESREHSEAIINTAIDAIITINTQGIIESFSPSAEKMFGYRSAEVIGHKVNILMPDSYAREHDDYLTNYLQTGEKKIIGRGREVTALRRDGTEFSAELAVTEIRSGDYRRFAGFIRDISSQKEAFERMLMLETTIETMLEGIQIIDSEWRYVYVNASAARQGRTIPSALIGRSILECYPGIENTPLFAVMQSVMRSREPNQLENEFKFPDGSSNWFALSIEPDEVGILIRSVDITGRRSAEKKLLKLNAELEERIAQRTTELVSTNRELESFSYSVSHDLRAPLRAIDGFCRALVEDFSDDLPDAARHYTARILRGADRMGQLIDDLLRYSRLNRAALQLTNIDMNWLLHDVLEDLDYKNKNINWHIQDLPNCYGDRVLLTQVWLNLISNAIKFSAKVENPEITIGYEKSESRMIEYFVKDNGVGFDMRHVQKTFGMFQRLHRMEEFEGNGVGLAIVQRVIHRLSGEVRAVGALNAGAKFTFTLPEQSSDTE